MSTALIRSKVPAINSNATDDIFSELKEIDQEVRQLAFKLFEDRGGLPGLELDDWLNAESALLKPLSISLEDKSDKFVAHTDVSGFTRNDLKVRFEKDHVKICGRISETKGEQNGEPSSKTTRKIRSTFTLPEEIDPKGATFRVENGVLTLEMPKQHSSASRNAA